MIVLYTDFGPGGPYVGQLHALLAQQAPGTIVIDLFHDLPRHNIRAAAYLLPAYTRGFPPGTVHVCVVDPGVGSTRRPLIVQADHRWYVGPDNGLFHVLAQRARQLECLEILWMPAQLSDSFHGRDLFAPVAAQLVRGLQPASAPVAMTAPVPDWPDDLPQVLYIDHFGNAITGLRADRLAQDARLQIGDTTLARARTYSETGAGAGFWYENSNGLAEIAVNQGHAGATFNIAVGDPVCVS
jgi:S-adenosyl-L-methionine hydrolase (adenosine-forming)